MRKTIAALAVLALAVGLSGSLAQAKTHHAVKGAHVVQKKKKKKPAPAQGNQVKHVFVIVLENHSQQGVIGDASAPYITSLAHQYAQAGAYYGVTHPSEPNYLAMISGSNWWINQDATTTRLDHVNLVDQLEKAHKTWAAYMEAMPADDKTADYWPSTTDKLYASKHNPFVLFNDIRNSASRMAKVKPYTDFATDLHKSETTPNFAFVVPDQCNDMHGGIYNAVPGHPETPCPYSNTIGDANDEALKQKADAFVKSAVQEIMASPSWHDGQDAIFVISDEGDYAGTPATAQYGGWASPAGCCDSPVLPAGDPDIAASWPGGVYGGGLVPAIVVVNKNGKTDGFVSQKPYNHYSLLATIEQVWGLSKLAYAADTSQVTPMTEFLAK